MEMDVLSVVVNTATGKRSWNKLTVFFVQFIGCTNENKIYLFLIIDEYSFSKNTVGHSNRNSN